MSDWTSTAGWVSSLVGGIFGGGAAERAEDQSFRQNKKVIQTRVADAKKAGVHPLFALNASVPTYSPASFMGGGKELAAGISDMGQNIDRAVAAQETPELRESRLKQLRLIESQIGETDARKAMYESETAKNVQELYQSKGIPGGTSFLELTNNPGREGVVKLKPDEMLSTRVGNPQMGAGEHPFWREYVLDSKGTKVLLPYSEEGPSEALESVPKVLYPYIIAVNRDRYGQQWGNEHIRKIFGPDYEPFTSERTRKDAEFVVRRLTGRQ